MTICLSINKICIAPSGKFVSRQDIKMWNSLYINIESIADSTKPQNEMRSSTTELSAKEQTSNLEIIHDASYEPKPSLIRLSIVY